MKANWLVPMLAIGLFMGSIANNALADYNTGAIDGSVTCTAGNLKVRINSDRSVIYVWTNYDPGHPESYEVAHESSDNDTFMTYISKGNKVSLSFDDQGDTVQFGHHKPIKLSCPQ